MGELNFQTGRKTYTVNGGVEISFEPSDPKFASAVVSAFQKCSDIAKASAELDYGDTVNTVSAMEKLEAGVRKEIDTAFGYAVCDKVFSGISAIAIADGLPVWTNFLMAVIDEVDQSMPEGEGRTKERVQKYMNRYENKYGKYKKR